MVWTQRGARDTPIQEVRSLLLHHSLNTYFVPDNMINAAHDIMSNLQDRFSHSHFIKKKQPHPSVGEEESFQYELQVRR